VPVLIFLLIATWLFYDGGGDPIQGVSDTIARITRGSKLTRAPYDPETGVVPGTPDDLAEESGLDPQAYALARMLSSEEGSSENLVKASVCWATINQAARTGQTIVQLVTHALTPSHSGFFGTQKDIEEGTPLFGSSDRYASTALDPYDGDGQIAMGCLNGSIPDYTSGATHFDRPGGEKHPDRVAADRAGEGLQPFPVLGIDPNKLRFWG
jgi:hypothetical protein